MACISAKQLGLRVQEVHLSECAVGPQKWLLRNRDFDCKVLCPDLSARNHSDPRPTLVCSPAVLTAGFPCRAFSTLHHASMLLEAEEAKPLFEIIKTITVLPVCDTCSQH